MSERLAVISAKLRRIQDARNIAQTDVWSDAWANFEQELLERLLKCGPDDDWSRYRLQIAIEVARQVRRTIETGGSGEAALVRELDILEGRKIAPIA